MVPNAEEPSNSLPSQTNNWEPGQPQPQVFNIETVANVCIPSREQGLVHVHITDKNGLPTPVDSAYEISGGIIAPGVILLPGVANQDGKVLIMNLNEESLQLSRYISFATATEVKEDRVLSIQTAENTTFQTIEVYTLMALTSITEEAFVTEEEYDSEPDNLEQALDYDPAKLSNKEVIYDKKRFQELLVHLKADTWKLNRYQRKAVERVFYDKQKAFNLPNEPLPVTLLIKHDIKLVDENKIIFVKPRWTPIHQRPPIEGEVKGLLVHNIATETTSPHSSPVVLVKKRDKGKWRLAVDYRELNKNTIPMFFSCSNIE